MRMSLRWKMLLLVFAVILAPLLILGINEFRETRNLITDMLRVTAREALSNGLEFADSFLKSVEESVAMLTLDPNIQSVFEDPEAPDRVVRVLEGYVTTHDDVENAFFGTNDKAFYVYPLTPGGLPPGFDPTARPWYTQAVAANGLIWTEPYIDTGTGQLVVTAAMPVRRGGNGPVIGVVGIDVTLNSLAELISSRNVADAGYLVLMDRSGLVLAHPQAQAVGKPMPNTMVLQRVLSTKEGELNYSGEEEMFVAYATLERTGWPLGAMVSYAEANAYVARQLGRTALIGVCFLLVAFAVGSLLTNRMLVRPVLQLAAVAEKLSQGDFTSEITLNKKDELGMLADSFRDLQKDLGRLIGEVKAASTATADLSTAVYRSSQEISASTEEMAATTGEFANSVQRTSDNVQSIDEDGTSIREISAQGQQVISEMVEQMKTIEASFAQLHDSVEQLTVKSTEIGKITDLIRGISDQTNLLALNAAIEAARAGEQGRGFAVVAEEVRSLAEQSAAATQQIANLLREVNVQIAHVRSGADRSIGEVRSGSSSVQVAGETFAKIGQAINNISNRIREVATYALELSSGSEEMAAATQEQAATLQEITSSANELAEQASQLMRLTERFQVRA